MVTKMQAQGAKVDWEAVERATEKRRTYHVKYSDGREVFKMYKPSEAIKIWDNDKEHKIAFMHMVGGKTLYDHI